MYTCSILLHHKYISARANITRGTVIMFCVPWLFRPVVMHLREGRNFVPTRTISNGLITSARGGSKNMLPIMEGGGGGDNAVYVDLCKGYYLLQTTVTGKPSPVAVPRRIWEFLFGTIDGNLGKKGFRSIPPTPQESA